MGNETGNRYWKVFKAIAKTLALTMSKEEGHFRVLCRW